MLDRAYRKYLLGVLLVIFAFNTKDRLIFALALQDIKADLSLSDTQLGLLTGIAFALFYSVMGIPIARWSDRGNRVRIIATCTALWSAAMALCALAVNFLQLLLIRIGVAVGEAGCVPPAHSLIADQFTRVERPRAMAIFQTGAPLSALIGYFLAGWLIEFHGWRMTFVLLGLPGVALAVLACFTLREPRKAKPVAERARPAAQPALREVFVTLWHIVTFRHLLFGYAVSSLFSAGVAQWNAAFFMRSYGMGSAEVGTWFAVIFGGFGMVATYLGGVCAARYAAHNERLQLQAAALAYVMLSVISTATYLSPSAHWAMTLLGVAALGTFAVSGPLFASIQALVPQRMRATAIALVFLVISLIGTGLGPLAAGMLSDVLRPWAGEESLRYALLALSPGYVWSAWHFWCAGRTVMTELEAQSGNQS